MSFFITARFAGQSDRVAFADTVIEQCAEILREPLPTLLTATSRDRHLWDLLGRAAQACLDRDPPVRLVLVVDGLDEGRGYVPGPQAHSIAALLPTTLPAGMRVVVAVRPNPPIPLDVAEDHLLWDTGVVQVLEVSPQATVVKGDMVREVEHLLAGSPAEQDLLGLLTAARGGLTAPDLAALTGWPVGQVRRQLGTVAGRTFAARPADWRPEAGGEVYLLGHEELQAMAQDQLGSARLDGYRARLHTWAGYHYAGWPTDTPEYLLRGYYLLLAAANDVSRMVSYATDIRRQSRLLDLSGGESAELAEVTKAMDLIVAQPEPDVTAMALLAFQRDAIRQRNANIPVGLPAVRVRLGHMSRAEASARRISDSDRQAKAMAVLVRALGGAGQFGRAESIAHSITHPDQQAQALVLVNHAPVKQRRRLLADALQVAGWSVNLAGVLQIAPSAIIALAGAVAGQVTFAGTGHATAPTPGIVANAGTWLNNESGGRT